MEAVTIHEDEYNRYNIIQIDTQYGGMDEMVVAQYNNARNAMTLTRFRLGEPHAIRLDSEAMNNLCKLWGATQEPLGFTAQNWEDQYHTVSRDAICLRAENEALRNEIDRMQSQESFRVALLESVASAAVLAAHEFQYGSESDADAARDALLVTIDALDRHADQPDDASTDVSVPETRHSPDWQCPGCGGVNKHHPECPELALVLGIAPVAPGVCSECGQSGGHDLLCKNEDDDVEWTDGLLVIQAED